MTHMSAAAATAATAVAVAAAAAWPAAAAAKPQPRPPSPCSHILSRPVGIERHPKSGSCRDCRPRSTRNTPRAYSRCAASPGIMASLAGSMFDHEVPLAI